MNIHFVSDEVQNVIVSVTDAYGRQIFEEQKAQYIGEYTQRIELEKYGKGVYILQIVTDRKVYHERIVVQ